MKITLRPLPQTRRAGDLLVLPVFDGELVETRLRELDPAAAESFRRDPRAQAFPATPGQLLRGRATTASGAPPIVLVGCGPVDRPSSWYRLADAAVRVAREERIGRLAVAVTGEIDGAALHALAEGLDLADQRFWRYRSQPAQEPAIQCGLLLDQVTAAHRETLRRAMLFARATSFARDLVNTPAADLHPQELGRVARRLDGGPMRVRVWSPRDLQRHRLGALLGVGRGSPHSPRLIQCTYRPSGRRRPRIALVGKGVTFDSGGLSLKNPQAMQTQKRDMAGGATVLAVMSVLSELRPDIEVHGWIPAAENMPGDRALRPGDVVTAGNGTTIEVLNTDAEGRLILADALVCALREKPAAVIDLATLTAAVRNALGTRCAAVLGTHPELVTSLIRAGEHCHERLWELPLIEDYRRDLDSTVADIRNVGEGYAGTIVAALFLREFVGRDVPWAHIDFSSTALASGDLCQPPGATGFGVRTLLHYLSHPGL